MDKTFVKAFRWEKDNKETCLEGNSYLKPKTDVL